MKSSEGMSEPGKGKRAATVRAFEVVNLRECFHSLSCLFFSNSSPLILSLFAVYVFQAFYTRTSTTRRRAQTA